MKACELLIFCIQCKTLPTSLEHHIENGHPGTHSTAKGKTRKN
uniref:Uncharacterized protein n=1 Tax=Cyprinus carpio TaxID=7962 RepID=A0A8C1TEE6_CYPCA